MEIPLEAPFSDGGQAVALDVAARNSVDEVLPRTYLLGLAEVREEAIAPVVGVAWVAHHFEPGRQAGGVELVHRFIKACEVEADGGEVGRPERRGTNAALNEKDDGQTDLRLAKDWPRLWEQQVWRG